MIIPCHVMPLIFKFITPSYCRIDSAFHDFQAKETLLSTVRRTRLLGALFPSLQPSPKIVEPLFLCEYLMIQFIASEIARSIVLELARLNNNRAGGPLTNSGSRSRTHTKFVDGEVGQRVAGTASYRRILR